MIRIKNNSSSKKTTLVIIVVLVGILALGAALYAYRLNTQSKEQTNTTPTKQSQIDYSAPTDDQKTAGATIKEKSVSTPEQTPTSTNITITSVDKSANTLYIRTLISEVTNSGSCTLQMTGPSGKTYSMTSKIQALASSSTCAGFDVPNDQLSSGLWTIKVTYTNDTTSTSASSEVTI